MRWYLVYRGFQHRAARFRRVPALDHARGGGARRTPQGAATCRLNDRDARDRRRPGRAHHEPPAEAARAFASRAGAASHRRALAQRTLGRPAVPVSQLVGAAAGLSVSAQRSRCVLRQRRDHQLHRGLCRLRRAADPLRRRGDAAVAARRRRFRRRDRDGTIAADNVVVATGPYQRPLVPDLLRDASRVSGPCQPLQQSRTASAGRGAGGRRRRVRRADRRGTVAAPAAASISRSAGTPPAAPLSRPRPDLVARRDAPRSDHAGAARTGAAGPGRSPAPMAATPSTSAASPPRASRCSGGSTAARDGVLDIAPDLAESLAKATSAMPPSSTWWTIMCSGAAWTCRKTPPPARAGRPALRHRAAAAARPRAPRASAR